MDFGPRRQPVCRSGGTNRIQKKTSSRKPRQRWRQALSLNRWTFGAKDEMRIGQRGTQMRLWARKGTRPRVVRQQQSESAYVFGAVCPQHDSAVGLVMPQANTEACGPSPAGPERGGACGTPRCAGTGPRWMAYHAQTAAILKHFIVAAASGLTRAQPGRAGVAATARPVSGQPLLRRLRTNN